MRAWANICPALRSWRHSGRAAKNTRTTQGARVHRRPGRSVGWVAGVCTVALAAAGCTAGHSGPPPTERSATHSASRSTQPAGGATSGGAVTRTPLTASSDTRVVVGGTAADPLVLHVAPGDTGGAGSVISSPSSRAAVAYPGFTPAGPVRDVAVTGTTLVKPVTVSFAAGAGHPHDLPVIFHYDRAQGWSPVALGRPGGTATASRHAFSQYLAGWVDPGSWASAFLAAIGRWATGRTTAPVCTSAPPAWATVIAPTLDVLLTCAQTNTADGVTRAEVQVKNNRGITQEITIPDNVAYASVQDQPDWIRSIVRHAAGGRNVVLLPPGARLSIGFTRPLQNLDITLTPLVANLALFTELLLQLGNFALAEKSQSPLAALAGMTGCTGAVGVNGGFVLGDTVNDVKDFLVSAAHCIAEAAYDLPQAVGLAEKTVAGLTSTPLAVVKSDASFDAKVEWWAGRFHAAGVFARVLTIATLARMAVSIFDAVGEKVLRAGAADDPATLGLDLVRASPFALLAHGRAVDPAAYQVGAWSPTGPMYPMLNQTQFHTPSGNISCAFGLVQIDPRALCLLEHRNFPDVPRPASCGEGPGWISDYVEVSPAGAVQGLCSGGQEIPSQTVELPYGATLRVGDYACYSAPEALTCAQLSTRHGFQVNRDHFMPF